MSDQIHQIVTDRMIAALEHGTVPWHKPWHPGGGQPRSMTTGAPYRGVNVFLLALTAAEHDYASPWWGTYRQITALGGQVRKGERSTLVVFWKTLQVTGSDPDTGEPATRQIPLLRYYRVFNAEQAGALPGKFGPQPGQDITLAEPQAVLDRYLATGPVLRHIAGDQADYHPATDVIRLPLRSQFRTPAHYYAAAFHETGHSTGHPSRLNRPGIAAFDHFGSGRYAREELVAEMTSAILSAHTGTDTPELLANSASYIAGWLTALSNDTKLVITAAAQAQRACDLITGPEREPAPEHHPGPGPIPADEPIPATAATAARMAPPGPGSEPVARPAQGRADVPAATRGSRPAAPGSPHRTPGGGEDRPTRADQQQADPAARSDSAPGRTPAPQSVRSDRRPQPTATGTQRRLRALMNRSWSPQAIERATGIPATQITRALARRRDISADLDQRVADAYNRLWDKQPPLATARDRELADAARAHADQRGWAPPAAYDDDLIDLPGGAPEPGWKRTRTTFRSADLVEDIEFVREHGGYRQADMGTVAMRLGVTRAAAEKAHLRTAARQAEAGYTPEGNSMTHSTTAPSPHRVNSRHPPRQAAHRGPPLGPGHQHRTYRPEEPDAREH